MLWLLRRRDVLALQQEGVQSGGCLCQTANVSPQQLSGRARQVKLTACFFFVDPLPGQYAAETVWMHGSGRDGLFGLEWARSTKL